MEAINWQFLISGEMVKTLLLMIARPCHKINNVSGGPDQSQPVRGGCYDGLRVGFERKLFHCLSVTELILSFITYESNKNSDRGKEMISKRSRQTR